jgi:hypothetical protein
MNRLEVEFVSLIREAKRAMAHRGPVDKYIELIEIVGNTLNGHPSNVHQNAVEENVVDPKLEDFPEVSDIIDVAQKNRMEVEKILKDDSASKDATFVIKKPDFKPEVSSSHPKALENRARRSRNPILNNIEDEVENQI